MYSTWITIETVTGKEFMSDVKQISTITGNLLLKFKLITVPTNNNTKNANKEISIVI